MKNLLKSRMSKGAAIILSLLIVATLASTALAAFDDSKLTWDGKPATLKEIAAKLDYDMVDASGNYKPMYYAGATELWNLGLMLGSDGSFDLDKPLTRTEGIIMALRLLGKEQAAKDAKLSCPFTDVPEWAKYQVAFAAKEGLTSGYSATVFGANDAMTANQYITFVLRAMGYSDKNGDFVWSSAADKALEIGLIGQSCRDQYMRSNLFLRDNVAMISCNALNVAKCKDGKLLIDKISIPGKPSGMVPSAVRAPQTTTPPATVTDDLPKSYLSHIEFVMDTIYDYKQGLRPQSNAYNYNQSGSLYRIWVGDWATRIEYGSPLLSSKGPSPLSVVDNPFTASREQLLEGTYDFAADPGNVACLYLDSGSFDGLGLTGIKSLTNNSSITQETLDTMQALTGAGAGSNVVIIYQKNSEGSKYGSHILLNVAGYHDEETDLGRPLFILDPGSKSFGKYTLIQLTQY